MTKVIWTLLAAASISITSSANALTTITNYAITGGPHGRFATAYDSDTSTYSLLTFDATVNAVHYDLSTVDLEPWPFAPANLTLGGTFNSAFALQDGVNDFAFMFDSSQVSQTVRLLYTSTTDQTGPFHSLITLTQVAAGVPEPATWVTLLLGFSLIGTALRHRTRASQSA